jgi:hypothetical protein
MVDTESDIGPVEPTISERTDEEEALADDITMRYGVAWVLVSAASDGDGLAVALALGPGMDIDLTRRLLTKTLEAL